MCLVFARRSLGVCQHFGPTDLYRVVFSVAFMNKWLYNRFRHMDRNPLESVQNDLRAALAAREELDRKITALQESIKILEPVYGDQPSLAGLIQFGGADDLDNLGITAAVERVLMRSPGKYMPPTAVRNGLVEGGFELTGGNPLASIHQVLRRIIARENSPYMAQDVQGTTMYMYDPKKDQAVSSPVAFLKRKHGPYRKSFSTQLGEHFEDQKGK